MKTAKRGERLTDRELEILLLVAEGHSANEAAIACSITPRTVESHLDTIRLKLGARDSTHMVAIAMAFQILPFEIPEDRGARKHGPAPYSDAILYEVDWEQRRIVSAR